MKGFVFAFCCLACASRARRVQTESRSEVPNALTSLLAALNADAAFSPAAAAPKPRAAGLATKLRAGAAQMQPTDSAAIKAQKAALQRQEEEEERQRTIEMDLEKAAKEAEHNKWFESLDDNMEVGVMSDFMYKKGVSNVLKKLDEDMVGMRAIKDVVQNIACTLIIDKMRMKVGLSTSSQSLHMSFTGPPGTGKTTVALRMGQILQRMGYCRNGHVVVATRDDLVGQYVGHTAPKTKEMVKKAMGGILFIDEAYYLYNPDNERDYGSECIEIITHVMETMPEDVIFMFAGYEDLMAHFYSGIPGIKSRIGHHLKFPDFENEELVQICELMCKQQELTLTEEAKKELVTYIGRRKQLPYFSNARNMRNLIQLSRLNMDYRIYQMYFNESSKIGELEDNLDCLWTIEGEDIPVITDEDIANQIISA